jgi:hypothetical protein
MGCAVSESLAKLLLRRSEGGPGAVIWGREAQPHFGRMFDRLLADGLLKERAPATTWAPCSICEGHCGERDIVVIGDRLVAECPEDHRRDSVLAVDFIRSFEIDQAALSRHLALGSGLAGEPAPLADGLWMLGRLPSGRTVMLALDLKMAADPRLVTLIRARSDPSETTLLLPSAFPEPQCQPLVDAGLRIVAAVDALTGAGFALNPAALAPALPGRIRLSIGSAGRTVTLDRRPIQLGDQPFRLLLKLVGAAQHQSGFVEVRDIDRAIYGDQIRPAARETRDIIRLLKDGLAAGLEGAEAEAARALIEGKRQPSRYRLALVAEEIDLRP